MKDMFSTEFTDVSRYVAANNGPIITGSTVSNTLVSFPVQMLLKDRCKRVTSSSELSDCNTKKVTEIQ